MSGPKQLTRLRIRVVEEGVFDQHETTDGLDLAERAEDYWLEHNPITPRESIAWNSP